jgi:hypothetical protein
MKFAELGNARLSVETSLKSVDDLDFMSIVTIDPSKIPDEILEAPSWYGYFAILSAQASSEESKKKFELEVLRSEIDTATRKTPTADGKKLTEAAIETAVTTNDSYKKAYYEWLEAKRISQLMDRMTSAIDKKLMMLTTHSANVRHEKNYEQVLNRSQAT